MRRSKSWKRESERMMFDFRINCQPESQPVAASFISLFERGRGLLLFPKPG